MPDKGINLIKYNYLNLPNQLQMKAIFENVTINTKYSANGTKLRKENIRVTSGFDGDTTYFEMIKMSITYSIAIQKR
ncbi:hypothetical protein [Chryseobacterium aquaticum]|uniref:hypothetical protein n=1 Tax=Chryseobacterium aquaticum TaxID=452084 RepID=UPI002FC8F179